MPLFPDVHGQLDVEADQNIRYQWRLINAIEQPDVGQRNKGTPTARPSPRGIQTLRQQTLLLLRIDVVHRGIVLGHQMVNLRPIFRFERAYWLLAAPQLFRRRWRLAQKWRIQGLSTLVRRRG